MNKKEALKRLEEIKTPTILGDFVGYYGARDLIDEIYGDKTQSDKVPLCLRNVLARLRGLPEHDRNIWLKGIMGEFKKDFSHAKWCEGYEQGKFDGAVEAEKSNTVVIPQFVADWVEKSKTVAARTLKGAYINAPEKVRLWWSGDNVANVQLFARAWLDGYEVEQERRYVVTDGNHLYFKKCQEDVEIVILADDMLGTMDDVKKFDSKDEAQKIADILDWKLQEVE